MKIASILATTAIVLAATASQSVEASVGNVALHGGKGNTAGTGGVHAADRQQLADFLHSNPASGMNFALALSEWLRERAAAPPSKRSSHQHHKHKQPASHSDSASDSGSGSAIDAHQAGHPHHHPHKQHSNKPHNHKKHSHKKHHSHKQHHSHHSASASGSGSDSVGFVAEVANPHPHHTGKPASILHLDNKDDQPSLHENAGLHEQAELRLASGSSSSSVDVDVDSEDSEDSEDIVFPPHGDEDADDSVDSVDSASSLPSVHGDVDAAGSLASTPNVETPDPDLSSSSNDGESVVIKPHLPNLRHSDPENQGDKDKSAAVTSLVQGDRSKQGSKVNLSTTQGLVVGAVCVVAGLVGVIAAAVGFRRVRRSDARYGASELIVDLPDPESVGDDEQEEEARDAAASSLADAPASTTNALDEAELHGMQSPFPRADEVGEFTNA